jgi:hypothetical protein
MIDPETIEDVDDCDGDAVYVYGFDPEKNGWGWSWLALQYLYESGRGDIIERLFPSSDEEAA